MARIIIIETDENEHVAAVLARLLSGATLAVPPLASPSPAVVELEAQSEPSARKRRRPVHAGLMEAVASAFNEAVRDGRPIGPAVNAVEGITSSGRAKYYVKRAKAAGLITADGRTRPRSATRGTPAVETVSDLDACPDDPDGLHHVGCGCDEPESEYAIEVPPPKPVFADPAPFIKRGPIDVDAVRARASEAV